MKQLKGTATVAQRVYTVVRERINDGSYRSGSRLTESQIAKEFATSRTPVREAMRLLAADGFVDFKPNSGTLVRSWSHQQICEIFELRVLVESKIVALAASHMTPELIAELRRLQDGIEARGVDTSEANASRIGALNREFHRLIADASKNEHLIATLAGAIQLPIVQRTFRSYSPAQLQRSFNQHRELIDAFEARDEGWAHSVMSSHIHAAKNTLLLCASDELSAPAQI